MTVTTSAPAVAPAATVTKESVENPYDLKHLWAQGDVVARGTLIILVIMSLASWYVLVTKLFESLKVQLVGGYYAARDGGKAIPLATKLSLSIFFGQSFDPSLDADAILALQASFLAEEGTDGGTSAPLAVARFGSLSRQEPEPFTPAQERAS